MTKPTRNLIAEHIPADAELAQRYHFIFENSPEGIFQSSPEGRYLNVNPAMAKIYGYDSPQDMLASVIDIAKQIYIDPSECARLLEVLAKHGRVENYEQKNRCKDGRIIWTATTIRSVHDAEGNLLYLEGLVQEITARKHMEEQTREDETKFRTLLEQLPAITYISQLDQYMGVSYISPQIETLGFDLNQWLADPELWFRHIHPEDQERVASALGQFQAGGEEFRIEYRLVLPNGKVRWIDDRSVYCRDQSGQPIFKQGLMLDITERKQEPLINHEEPGLDAEGNSVSTPTTKIPLRDEDGQVIGLMGIGRDVNERKRTDARINELLEFNEKILKHSPLGILTYRVTGECVFANLNAALIMGASVEQLQAQNFHTIESWKKSGLYNLVTSAIGSLLPVTADLHHQSTFGKDVWVTVHCVTFHSKNEDHLLLTITDITDRKLAEERLRQSESRYRLATRATNDVIWEWNPVSNQLSWSQNAPIVFGYEPEEIAPYATWWDERIHPDDGNRVMKKLSELVAGAESIWMDEYRFMRKDGSYAYISDRGYVERDPEGRALRMIGAMADITDRKQAEVERQALLEIMQGLAHPMDLAELLGLIHQSIAKVICARNFFVVLQQPHTGLFEEIYSVDQYDLPEPPSRLEKSITSYVFRSGEPLLLTQARFVELVAQGEVQLIGTNSKSWLGVPLMTSGKTIGVMAVQDYEREQRYSERDRDFLASIAAQVALVIQRKQAEERLREREEQYRAIFEGVQDAILVESTDGRILMVNEQACEMYGYSQEEFLSKTVFDLVPPGHAILTVEGMAPGLSAEPVETINRRVDGELFPIEISGRVLIINGEAVELILVRDITQRKQAEIELQQKNEDLRLLNAINEAVVRGENLDSIIELLATGLARNFSEQGTSVYSTVYILNPDQQTLVMQKYFFSPQILANVERLLGFSIPMIEIPIREGGHFHKAMSTKRASMTSDPEGIKAWLTEFIETKYLHPLARPLIRRLIPQVYKILSIKSAIAVPLISENETIGFLDVSSSHLLTPNDMKRLENLGGQLTAAIQRQRANEKLRRSEEFLQSIQNALSASIAILDELGTIVQVNAAWCHFGKRNGFSHPNNGVGLNYLHICDSATGSHAEEAPRVAQAIRAIIAGQKTEDRIEYACHSSEQNHWFTLHMTKFEDGDHLWVVLAHEEITERKQAEIAEREQRALAEALRDTAEWLGSTLEYGEVLDHILAAVERVVPHDAATIMLLEEGMAQVVRLHGYDEHGLHDEVSRTRLPVAETANLRQMVEMRQPVVVHDTHAYPGWKRLESTEWLRSSVGAPISIYGKVIGFICLDAESPEFFTPIHGERLQAFANQAALAIHNARLLQQAQMEIAERKQAESELRASEERFRQLADNIQEAFWITDAKTGAEIYASPAMERIWNRPAESSLYESNALISSVFPEDKPALLEAIEREKRGERVEIEYRIVRPDGSLRWVWDRAFPIFDEQGNVIRVAGISADVTERRESEMALVKSQSRYRELFDSSPISLWEEDFSEVKRKIDLLRASGVTDLDEYFSSRPDELLDLASKVKITDVNQAAIEIYRVEEKDVLLKSLSEIVSKSALSHFREELQGLSSPSRRFVWEGTDRPLDGRNMEVIATGSIPHGYEEDWSKVLVSITDITERKQVEEEVRRRAEETAALLETSLALTDLDLNAILRTISNSAKELFAADGCRVFLMEPDGQMLRCVLALQEDLSAFSDLRIKLGEGVTGAVALSGRAEIVNQMQNDPRAVQVAGTPNEEEAIMFAPLKERDRTIGVLSIRRVGQERHFEPADLELLEALAAMAASAVSNARLFEETQHRLAELEALYENGLAVGRLLEPRQIGERIIETFARYLRWHHVTIRLQREASDDLELVAFNLPELSEEERAHAEKHFITLINKIGQGLSGWAIQTGKALRTGNVHAHPQYVNMHSGIQSGLYMPLKAGERVIGVISVESEEPDAFTAQDERLLATLASQAAIAFENARLYEAIQKELVERTRAEEALRSSEAHYRELADSITDILFEMDHEMRYTHWNKASEMLLGAPASDVIGKSMRDIFGESDEQTRIGKIYASVLKDRQPKTFETTLMENKTVRSFEVNAYPSRRGVSVVAKDVTDRKRAEIIMQKRFELMEYSAHHTLNELIQRTVDEVSELTGSTIGFLHFVEADQKRLGMQFWSTNALRKFSVALSEGAHRPLDQAGLWAEAVRQRRPLIQNDYISLGKITGLPPGHEPIVRELVIPIIRNEKLVAVLGIANKPHDYAQHDLDVAARLADYAWDITERKQMEIALETERNQLVQRVEERTADLSRANSNLARALRVKDEFLANMSHELRTPLNAILGLSESLAEQIAGPLNEKQQKYITTIGESGHHLLALINDILDLAKIEAGQIILDINKVDIHSVCQSSLRMIKQLAQKKNQEVTLTIQEGLGLMWADERRLKQMMVNLLGNAVKFTPESGKLGLEVHGDEDANKVTITVWDTGIGIKSEDLERLFQPFVQLDSGLARETTGTGLGLALVAQMARLHGGSVTAFSEPGVGSRFSVVLPWEPALAIDAATRLKVTGKFRAINPDEGSKPTILLVEDTKEVIMMVQDYLELAGYKVFTAQDGVDAIVQAKLVHPDLILMDVQMPRMDGMEATQKLRSEPEFKYTPIIALTALAMPNDRERCLAAGMDEYISKPVNLRALVKLIQACLFSAREPSPS